MSGLIDSIERAQLRKVPAFQAGDRVRVHFQVVEGTRRRTQVFEGIVIKRQGTGVRETFTVRKQSFGVGVERTFPVHSPKIERIEIAARGDVRRAKLYYLRDRVGRGARVRERRFTGALEPEIEAGVMPQDEDAARPGEEELAEVEAEAAEAEAAEGEAAAEAGDGDEAAPEATETEAAPEAGDAAEDLAEREPPEEGGPIEGAGAEQPGDDAAVQEDEPASAAEAETGSESNGGKSAS